MRDPSRITPFITELKKIWKNVPDWRFGQLMSNFLGFVVGKAKMDIFYIEDEEMLNFLKDYEELLGGNLNTKE